MVNETLTEIQRIVSEQLGVDAAQVQPEASFTKELGADSLDVVELVMLIEDEFDIEIEDEIANQITTIRGALDYIEQRQKKS